MVATAISRAVQQLGIGGCAGRMAQEFGDHPDAAARRMRWVRQLIAQEPAAMRLETGHERELWPVRTCGPGGLPRVPGRPALPVRTLREPATAGAVRPRPGHQAGRDAGRHPTWASIAG
jgi:hypothetical protein